MHRPRSATLPEAGADPAALARSPDEFRQSRISNLFDFAPWGMAVLDLSGRYLDANRAYCELLGYQPEELVGTGMIVHTHPEDRRRNLKLVRQMMSGELNRYQIQKRYLRKDGTPVEVLVTVSLVRTPEGRPLHALGLVQDLTDRQQALEARRESQAKSKFLASMSHELRTPLNSILGFSQLLTSGRAGELNDKQRRYLAYVESSGRHLLDLINDVLDLSKVQAGQMEVQARPVVLIDCIAECLAEMEPQADVGGVELELACPRSLRVLADPTRLRQILLNLLANAVKFTSAGGHVLVSARRGEGSRIHVDVRDTGIGIPSDQLDHIFGEFTQLRQAGSGEGTGLGLALSRRLAELMEGTLEVASEHGAGSTFTLTLPASAPSRRRRASSD